MTQREFERRVKGIVDQPRRRARREPSEPGRAGRLVKAALATLCVAVLVVLTANGSRYFALHQASPGKAVQVTEEQAIAQANAAPAVAAKTVEHPTRHIRHDRAVASAAAAIHAPVHRHFGRTAAAATGHKGVVAGIQQAAATASTSDDDSLGGAVGWVRSTVRSAFTPLLGADEAQSAADGLVLHLPVAAGAGAFLIVMLLCLGIAMASSARSGHGQSAET